MESESLLHKKGVFRVEVETRSEVGDQAKKKKNESECREPGKENAVDQRADG